MSSSSIAFVGRPSIQGRAKPVWRQKESFYYSPQDLPAFKYDPALDWTTWTSWKKADAESIGRGYNYPHVIAAYWSMYRLARNHQGWLRTIRGSGTWTRRTKPRASCLAGRQTDVVALATSSWV